MQAVKKKINYNAVFFIFSKVNKVQSFGQQAELVTHFQVLQGLITSIGEKKNLLYTYRFPRK